MLLPRRPAASTCAEGATEFAPGKDGQRGDTSAGRVRSVTLPWPRAYPGAGARRSSSRRWSIQQTWCAEVDSRQRRRLWEVARSPRCTTPSSG